MMKNKSCLCGCGYDARPNREFFSREHYLNFRKLNPPKAGRPLHKLTSGKKTCVGKLGEGQVTEIFRTKTHHA